MDIDKALATQLANIEKRTGKTVAELVALVQGSGLAKHGEQVAMLKQDLGMGHGDANTIAHMAKRTDSAAAVADADPLDEIYVGAKAGLRPIHEALSRASTPSVPTSRRRRRVMSACAARNSSPRSVPPPRPRWRLA